MAERSPGRSAAALAKGIDMTLQSIDREDGGQFDPVISWSDTPFPGFDMLYHVHEKAKEENPLLNWPMTTLYLAKVEITEAKFVEMKRYPGAMIIYIDRAGEGGPNDYVRLELGVDPTTGKPTDGYAMIQHADKSTDRVLYSPDGTADAQLIPGDAAWLIDATFELKPSTSAKTATYWIAGVGKSVDGACGSRPCP